jgi:hypothetical protein
MSEGTGGAQTVAGKTANLQMQQVSFSSSSSSSSSSGNSNNSTSKSRPSGWTAWARSTTEKVRRVPM